MLEITELVLRGSLLIYDYLRADDELGIDVQQYEERDISTWGESGHSSSFRFRNQGIVTANEYVVNYSLFAR